MSKKSGYLPILIGLWEKKGLLGCRGMILENREKESARLAGFVKELGYE